MHKLGNRQGNCQEVTVIEIHPWNRKVDKSENIYKKIKNLQKISWLNKEDLMTWMDQTGANLYRRNPLNGSWTIWYGR